MAEIAIRAGTKAVLRAGPTASGKSRLAVELAQEHGGLVVNADSMQVYAELRIVTARPGEGDEATRTWVEPIGIGAPLQLEDLARWCVWGQDPSLWD